MRRRSSPSTSRGRWAVQRERLHLSPTELPEPPDGVTQAGDCLDAVLKHPELNCDLWQRELMNCWVEIVGDKIARQARPGRLRNGNLTVFVRSPAWMNELIRYSRQAVLDHLQERFGADRIRNVHFAPDPDIERA